MTIIDCPTPTCILQERAYSDGWRDYAMFRIVSNPGKCHKFYMMGWKDNEGRTRLEHERRMAQRENK